METTRKQNKKKRPPGDFALHKPFLSYNLFGLTETREPSPCFTKFIHQKGVRSIIDEDARVGRKSKSQDFFGYKTEFTMTTDERIITSVRTANEAYMDGDYTKEMLNDILASGITVKEVYADKAYFRKTILTRLRPLKQRLIFLSVRLFIE